MGTKQARNFGGRPTERQPEPGKKVHMSLAVPLTLKRRIEQAAKKRGWSVSNEAALLLELALDRRPFDEVLSRIREHEKALRQLRETYPELTTTKGPDLLGVRGRNKEGKK